MINRIACVMAAALLLPTPSLAMETPHLAADPARPARTPMIDAEGHIDKLEFKTTRVVDVMRTLSELTNANIVVTEEAGKKVTTVFLKNVTVREAIEIISKNAGLWYRLDRNGKTFRVMTTDEYQRDMVVYREDVTRVFNLLHPNPVVVATAIRDLYGDRVILSLGVMENDFAMGAGSNASRSGLGSVAGGAGTLARSGQASLRRSTTANNTVASRSLSRSSRTGPGNARESELVVTDKLTPDQLAALEGALQEGGAVSAEVLRGVSRTEAPIYITVNREHNLILVRTSDTLAIREIERLIKEMDRPTPQVLLEMKILELTMGDSFSQLFNMGLISGNGKHELGLGNAQIPTDVGSLIYTFIDDRIAARLELLQKNNQLNTLSSPILLASNNRPARVFVGEERILVTGVTATDPVLNASGGVVTPAKITYQTEIRDIGNTLNIIPKINADRTVTLSIQQDSSTVLEGAITLPPITVGNSTQSFNIDSVKTANIEGIVVAKDGLSVAIGGLISTSSNHSERKVPLLGDIPLVGELFKRKEQSKTKSELILIITPRIITNPSETEDVSRDTVEPLSIQEW